MRDAAGRRVRLRDDARVRVHRARRGRSCGSPTRARTAHARPPARTRARDRRRVGLRPRHRRSTASRDGSYRGALRLHRDDGRTILVVNELGLESYLQGVVAAEMPSTWAAEALKAQAVVARSYALRSRRPDRVFDVFADVRSQVYRGVAGEAADGGRGRARHARARRPLRRRDRPDVLPLDLRRPHGG